MSGNLLSPKEALRTGLYGCPLGQRGLLSVFDETDYECYRCRRNYPSGFYEMQWLLPSSQNIGQPIKLQFFVSSLQIPFLCSDIASCILYVPEQTSISELSTLTKHLRRTLYLNRLNHYRLNVNSSSLWRCLTTPKKTYSYLDEPDSISIKNNETAKRFSRLFSTLWENASPTRNKLEDILRSLKPDVGNYIRSAGEDYWFFLQAASVSQSFNDGDNLNNDIARWRKETENSSKLCPRVYLKVLYDPLQITLRDEQIGISELIKES